MSSLINWYTNTSFHQWWVTNVWKPTYTKATIAIYGVPSAILGLLETAAQWSNDATITGYLNQLHVPNYVFMGLAGLALVHYVATDHN